MEGDLKSEQYKNKELAKSLTKKDVFVGAPKATDPPVDKEKLQKPLVRTRSINKIIQQQATDKLVKSESIERMPEGEFGRLKSEWEHGEVKKVASPVSPTVEHAEVSSLKRVGWVLLCLVFRFVGLGLQFLSFFFLFSFFLQSATVGHRRESLKQSSPTSENGTMSSAGVLLQKIAELPGTPEEKPTLPRDLVSKFGNFKTFRRSLSLLDTDEQTGASESTTTLEDHNEVD